MALGLDVLARALKPFPLPVRILGALRLATIEFLLAQGRAVQRSLLKFNEKRNLRPPSAAA